MNPIAFSQFLDLKKEGELCGYSPNGTVCDPDRVFGICEEGLTCFKKFWDCSPGICEKIEIGKTWMNSKVS